MWHFTAGQRGRYSDWLRAGRSGDRIPVEARFSAPVQTGPGAHPASCTMRSGSFPGVNSGRSLTLTPHPLLVPWSRKSRAIPLLPLWAVRPVQSLTACTRVQFTLFFSKITGFPLNTNSDSEGLTIPLHNLLAPVLNGEEQHGVGQSLRSGSSVECWMLRFELRNMWGVRDVSHCNWAQLT